MLVRSASAGTSLERVAAAGRPPRKGDAHDRPGRATGSRHQAAEGEAGFCDPCGAVRRRQHPARRGLDFDWGRIFLADLAVLRVGNRGRVPRLERLFPGADLGRGHPPGNGEGRLAGSRLADAHHAEGQELAFSLAHRDVLADPEGVVAEAEAFLLLFILASRLPLEGPGRAAEAARAMDEQPAHRRLAPPETVRETLPAMLLPSFEIDVAVVGQRRDEIIAVPNGPFRKFFRARGVQDDL